MAEPRDEISEWLGQEVQPLAPPPGTFARIQRRARRRKMNQALMTAASAVIVIAGAALAPTVIPSLLHGGGSGKGSSSPWRGCGSVHAPAEVRGAVAQPVRAADS